MYGLTTPWKPRPFAAPKEDSNKGRKTDQLERYRLAPWHLYARAPHQGLRTAHARG